MDDVIDGLLERYLDLLHEYTELRTRLGELSGALYQTLARANFTAERGVRYGQDFYDGRMQSSRHVAVESVTEGEDSWLRYKVVSALESQDDEEDQRNGDDEDDGDERTKGDAEKEQKKDDDDEVDIDRKAAGKSKRSADPLRWFGILTPMPLRQAQGRAIEAVEQIIPRLVSVDAEMKALEIQVRRARKRRAKAEAAAEKPTKKTVDDGKAATSREVTA
jgi:hypothetical protein